MSCGNCLHDMACVNCATYPGVCVGPNGIMVQKASLRDPYGQTLFPSGWDVGPYGQSMIRIGDDGLVYRVNANGQ